MSLVLSLFPGLGLLDHAFELEEGFCCVVKGPDVLWGSDIRRFHPPSGVFDGVIGGPPCPHHSTMHGLVQLERNAGTRPPDLIPEFVRVVAEAQPRWWLSENARQSYAPEVEGYSTHTQILDHRWVGGVASRQRRITFGVRGPDAVPLHIETDALEPLDREPAVLAGHGGASGRKVRGMLGRNWRERARAQGFCPDDYEASPFTAEGLGRMFGNGVPLKMGRALARAIRSATGEE